MNGRGFSTWYTGSGQTGSESMMETKMEKELNKETIKL